MHRMLPKPIHELTIGIKGAGEMATAIAWRLYMANIRQIFMMENGSADGRTADGVFLRGDL